MYDMSFLKKVRKEKKITIHDMSVKLHITPSYYWKLENKRRRLFYDMAIRLAAIFCMKPDELFYTKEK